VAFWLTRADGHVLLRRRPEQGLLGGMVEIPSTPWREAPWRLEEAVELAPTRLDWSRLPGTVRHGFTHFQLELAILAGTTETGPVGLWSPPDRLGEHALPTLIKKLVAHAISALSQGTYDSASKSGMSSAGISRNGANERR
jgi:A/G-specific adenine glycosylase